MKFTTTKVLKISEPVRGVQYQYIATFTGSIVIVCTGMIFGWATPSLPTLLSPDSPIPISSSDGSWMAVMPCIGAVVGCLAAATFADKIGRKYSMLIVSPLYFISWMMIAFAKSIWIINSSRFLSGVGDGIAFTVFPMYLGEISTPNIRGLLCSSIPVTTVLGFLLISVVASHLSIQNSALISSSTAIIHFVTFYFMPESPYFLLMKGNVEKAKRMLVKLRGTEDVDNELCRLQQSVKEESEIKSSIWDLFTVSSNRKGVYIVVGLRGLQQFCGHMAITFYATIIFKESGSSLSASSCTNIYFTIQVVCAIICSTLVDKLGRKPLLLLSTVGACVSLATEAVYFYLRDFSSIDVSSYSLVPVLALLCYNILFNLGIGTVPVMMLGELFSPSVKAFALCLADIYFGIVVIIVAKFFQIMKDDFGIYVPFVVFAACSALATIYVIFCVPETKGKTLEEIQEYFKSNKKIEDVEKTDT